MRRLFLLAGVCALALGCAGAGAPVAGAAEPAFLHAFGARYADTCTTSCQTGSYGGAAGQLYYPFGVAVSGGDVYVTDQLNHRIDVFDAATGAFKRAFGKDVDPGGGDTCTTSCQTGSGGGAAGQMYYPSGVAVSGGDVYVADANNQRIAVFDAATGAFKRAFGKNVNPAGGDTCTTNCQTGNAGGDAGQMNNPYGVAVSGGDVYVTDQLNQRIDVYDATTGVFKRAFGKNVNPGGGDTCTTNCTASSAGGAAGQLNNPYGVAVSGGELYVADSGNGRIDVYDAATGSFQRAFGKNVNPGGGDTCTTSCQTGSAGGAAGQMNNPSGVAVSGGDVYVVDLGNQRIDVFDAATGAFERAFGKNVNPGGGDTCTTNCQTGSNGGAAGQMNNPSGVAVSGGDVYVADQGNQRIDVFDAATGAFQRAFSRGVGSPMSFDCTTASGCRSGDAGVAAGQLSGPLGVAVSGGDVYVADTDNFRIDVFDAATGAFERAFGKNVNPGGGDTCTTSCQVGSYGGAAGQMNNPSGVAVSGGDVYVADQGNQRIDVFDAATGAFERAFGKDVNPGGGDTCTTSCQTGSAGAAAGQLNAPTGVAVHGGDVYVADQGNQRIDVFDAATGAFERAFGKDVNPGGGNTCTTSCQVGSYGGAAGQLNNPSGVAVDGGELYVADLYNFRIAVFDAATGAFERAFGKDVDPGGGDTCTTSCQTGSAGGAAGQFYYPTGVAVSSGELYVAGYANQRIDVYDAATGTFQQAFGKDVDPGGGDTCTTSCQTGSYGGAAGQLNNPFGVAVSGGELYVADQTNQRIAVYGVGSPGTGAPGGGSPVSDSPDGGSPGAGSPGGGPSGGGPSDKPGPVVSHLRTAGPRCVRDATLITPRPGDHGLAFEFSLSEPATVRYTLLRRAGSPRWRSCPQRQGTTGGHYEPIQAVSIDAREGKNTTTLAHAAAAERSIRYARGGRHRISLARIAAGRHLRPGTYILRVTATSGGRSGNATKVKFWVMAGSRKHKAGRT